MVLTSPFSSIRGYILSKPPLVLFTLCLVGFAITTFTFAYYVEHNHNFPNLDAKRDLDSFLSHLSRHKLCVSPTPVDASYTAVSAKNSTEIENLTSVWVTAKVKSSKIFFSNLTSVQGHVTVLDWIAECTALTIENVKILFHLPNSTYDQYEWEVCVKLTGPYSLFAPIIGSNQCQVGNFPVQQPIWGHVHQTITVKSEKCLDNFQQFELTYEPDSFNGLSLSTQDRSIINLHLFHTSYFLLVMAITLICYAMIKGKPHSTHQSMDKMPLDV